MAAPIPEVAPVTMAHCFVPEFELELELAAVLAIVLFFIFIPAGLPRI
ncbi:hypothetical protein KUC_1640 [Vreelandella boliviensis LC1]|uniref:Uncharacterized protein n=1 Tax=Vreelandella boliviensis LC1 TaxID=1072583 RepID=A0A7U9C3S2_9GAMM|nr:hypothetical protein [Halomonas boliviensis]EHJ94681.1 hypothetical protein KUC_1640 [Halomonas boliviensis LC1]